MPTIDSNKPTILLITSGYHLYREYLLKMIAERANVWLFADRELVWESPYVIGHSVVNTLDVGAMTAAARALPPQISLDGVLCWDEIRMVVTAELARALGLPGGDPEAIGQCRDKHKTRTALARAGVPQATSILVGSLQEARDAVATIGYPAIFKPRALGASFGVSLVQEEAELVAAYEHARTAREDGVPYYDEGVLVEEYMQGEEISIDSAIVDGRVAPLFVARKLTGFFPHFEEIGHVVDAADPLLSEPSVLEVLERAHEAVGFRTGITHTELRLTDAGPKIVEINARLGGDMIPYVGWVATGIDPGRVAVDVACGRASSVGPQKQRVAAIRFFYPDRDSVVERLEIDDERLPPSVETAGALATPGQRLVLPPADHVSCRYGYVVVHGESAVECTAAAGQAERAFQLTAVPAP